MCDLHRRRSSSLYFIFVVTFVVCIHTTFAATPNASSSATDVAVPSEPSALARDSRRSAHGSSKLRRGHRGLQTRNSAIRQALEQIGVAYHHMFALEQARKYYQMALAMNPNFPEALNNLAAVYHGQHEYKQAERTYKLALKYAPDAAITYCNLGTAYFAEEKYKPGMEAYRKALALNPNIFDPGQTQIVQETTSRRQLVAVNYYLAKTYATAGKMQEAIGYLRKALEAGFKDRKQLMKDKEFAALRSTPEFHQLMVEQNGGE